MEDNHCYNKKCQDNDQNGYCLNRNIECELRMNKLPAFYEERYKKLKEENERLKKEIEEGYEVIENEYKNKIFIAEQENKKIIDSLMLVNDKYMEKQKKMESDLIKYENTIKNLKGIIKNMSEVL